MLGLVYINFSQIMSKFVTTKYTHSGIKSLQ